MSYNISDTPLKLKEYGRNIQTMIEYAKSLEDKEKQARIVKEIIGIMSNLNPHLIEIPDYKQKLWGDLLAISNFELDIELPDSIKLPKNRALETVDRMDYHNGRPRYKQYGWNVELMIHKAIKMEKGKEKDEYINLIANTMKLFLRNMDRETTPEAVIAEHIREISGGKLKVKGEDLTFTKPISTKSNHRGNNNNHHKRGGRNNGRGRKRKSS